MSWQFVRNLLVVLGVYWLATEVANFLSTAWAATGLGFGTGAGFVGEIWLYAKGNAARAAGAAGASAVLWFVLGPLAARRWAWCLATLFAVLGFLSSVRGSGGPWNLGPRATYLAVYALLPAIACIVVVELLRRFAPPSSAATQVELSEHPSRSGSRLPIVVWSVVMLLLGTVAGGWMVLAAHVRETSAEMAAFLEGGWRAQYTFSQYREVGYEAGKAMLEEYAAYLSHLDPKSTPWQPGQSALLDEQGLAVERLLTYGRLAVSAEKANRADDAARYWPQAEQQARAAKWSEPTRERIRATIARLDSGPSKPPPQKP